MILLIGGTTETGHLAGALARAGYRVLVSYATGFYTNAGEENPLILRRSGKLDAAAMEALIEEMNISAIVDASHPYAEQVHQNAFCAASRTGIPYFRWHRAEAVEKGDSVHFAANHEEAATITCSFGKPVLATVGSTHLEPYVRRCKAAGIVLTARVLSGPDSVSAARSAGLCDERIIQGIGPFSVEENLTLIRRFGIGVIVTKDSGREGGVPEKLEAAKRANCRAVVVARPGEPSAPRFDDASELLAALASSLAR